MEKPWGWPPAAGIQFDSAPTDQPWLWREARLRDPAGNSLCLYSAGPNRRHPPWRVGGPSQALAAPGEEITTSPRAPLTRPPHLHHQSSRHLDGRGGISAAQAPPE